MNILVTGATGGLGARIVELLEKQSTVKLIIATGRTQRLHNTVVSSKVKYVLGDLTNQEHVKELFTYKIDAVINCASLSSPWGTYNQFKQANISTQELLIKHAELNKVNRFIYISSPSVYATLADNLNCKEDDIPNKQVNYYAKTKWEAEKLLQKSNLAYIVIRPRALIGRWDNVIFPRLINAYNENKLRVVGDGKNIADLTGLKNVAHAVHLSLFTDDKNCREAYNITNDEPIVLWDGIKEALQKLELNKPLKKVGFNIAYKLAHLLELKHTYFNKKTEPALTRYSVSTLAKSTTLDITKAKTKLKYKPIQTTQEAITEFVTWYKNKK